MNASNSKKIERLLAKNQRAQKKLESFESTLLSMENVQPQKMYLWLEIYNNAVSDRSTASILLTQGFVLLGQTASDHVSLGSTLVKYLERMTKANDQLLSLSQIIAKEIEESNDVNSEKLFREIEG